jgi:hypothetical protein
MWITLQPPNRGIFVWLYREPTVSIQRHKLKGAPLLLTHLVQHQQQQMEFAVVAERTSGTVSDVSDPAIHSKHELMAILLQQRRRQALHRSLDHR